MSFCYSCKAFMPCTVHLLSYFFIIIFCSALSLSSFFLSSVLLLSPVAVTGSVDRWRCDRIGGDLTELVDRWSRDRDRIGGSLKPWPWPNWWIVEAVTGSLETERCPPPRGWAVRRPPPSSVGTEITDPRPQPQRQALAFGEERERWKEEREKKYKLLKKF